MLLHELIYDGFSFDILLGPFHFFMTANLSTASTKKYYFLIQFQIFLGFPGDLVGNEPQNGILVEGLKNVL